MTSSRWQGVKNISLFLLLLALFLLGCGNSATPSATVGFALPTNNWPPTETVVLPTATATHGPGTWATVTRVIDGDTIEVVMAEVTERVRYIGMDTPERGDFFFGEATEANSRLVAGQQVLLVRDVSERDRYSRLLRYVYLEDGTFVNAELVKQGFAVIATFPPDVAYQDLFLELEREARAAGRGLWGQPTNQVLPSPFSLTPLPTSQAGCDPSYPTLCIPPAPPDLDCGSIPYQNFTVLPPDPHRFDGDNDGIGCEG